MDLLEPFPPWAALPPLEKAKGQLLLRVWADSVHTLAKRTQARVGRMCRLHDLTMQEASAARSRL